MRVPWQLPWELPRPCHRPIRATQRVIIPLFADKRRTAIWTDRPPTGFSSDLARISWRKLPILAAATRVDDLRQPPRNHLEPLIGDRSGQHGIRLSDQWRLCFVRRDGEAYDVAIVDDHRG